MNKARSIFKNDFINIISRRSFILTLILIPLVPTLILGVLNLLNRDPAPSLQDTVISEAMNPLPYGVVDLSGLITNYPDWLVQGSLKPEPNEATARELTQQGKLQGFYRIAADYLSTGSVVLVKPQVSMITEVTQGDTLQNLIDYNLLGSNQALYLKFNTPLEYQVEPLDPNQAVARDTSNLASFFMPYGVTVFFYLMILVTSSLMLEAVGKEKENRVMEMLLSSVRPIDILTGKIVALGLAGLLQVVVWYGAGILLLRTNGNVLAIPTDLQIPLQAILLAIPFFLLGYTLFGSLMAGLGGMAPNLREANQYTIIITMPLIFTMLSITSLIQAPSGSLSTFLSIFPFTSPVAMMARLSVGDVPIWQVVLSLVILILTVIFVLRGVANIFRAQTLLTGQKFKVGTFFQTLLGRNREQSF